MFKQFQQKWSSNFLPAEPGKRPLPQDNKNNRQKKQKIDSQPQTNKELRTWIEEYCRGEKKHGEPNTWDVTNVTDMSKLFANSLFNAPIDTWDTSKVTNMRGMFFRATSFNQPLDGWDTSAVTTMDNMFFMATSFNQLLNGWDTSAVTNMHSMFSRATSFNQPLDGWDTSAVTTMKSMFQGATSFNKSVAIDTSKVTDMSYMFQDAFSFNQPLNGWDTSAVTDMKYMFMDATSFNQPLNGWDTSQVTEMQAMFMDANWFNQPLGDWDTSAVTDMGFMFYGVTSFNQPLGWDTSKVTDMRGMFCGAESFNQPLGWDTSKVTDMSSMFRDATSFNQPLGWDTSKVTDMRDMFMEATSFDNGGHPLTISTSLNLDYLPHLQYLDMFQGAIAFTQRVVFNFKLSQSEMVWEKVHLDVIHQKILTNFGISASKILFIHPAVSKQMVQFVNTFTSYRKLHRQIYTALSGKQTAAGAHQLLDTMNTVYQQSFNNVRKKLEVIVTQVVNTGPFTNGTIEMEFGRLYLNHWLQQYKCYCRLQIPLFGDQPGSHDKCLFQLNNGSGQWEIVLIPSH
jgi:surface protein